MRKNSRIFSLRLLFFVLIALGISQSVSIVFGGTKDDELRAIQEAIRAQGANWTAGSNPIWELPKEEWKKRCGAILTEHRDKSHELAPPTEPQELDEVLDWRNRNGHNWVTGIRDQWDCGSCWAFAALASMESRTLIMENLPEYPLDLSEQFLLSCIPRNCVDGYYLDLTCSYLQNVGTVDEDCFPYWASDLIPCSERCSDWQLRNRKLQSWSWVGHPWENNEQAIKSALRSGPVSVYLTVFSDLYAYQAGVYQHVEGEIEGGHFVSIVGWEDNANCWICKNSWSEWWGEDGYFRIRKGTNECEIESEIIAMIPEIPYASIIAPSLACTEQGVQPNPSTLSVLIYNNSLESCSNINVLMSDGSGLGGTFTVLPPNPQTVQNLGPHNYVRVDFGIDLNADPSGGDVGCTAMLVSADCGTIIITGGIEVPPCANPPQPGHLFASITHEPLICTEQGVQPNPLTQVVDIHNNGGSVCYNISVHMSNGTGPGGTFTVLQPNPQSIQSLAPGSEATISFATILNCNPLGGLVNCTIMMTSSNSGTFSTVGGIEVPPCCRHINPGDLCAYPIQPNGWCWTGNYQLCDYCNDYDLSPCTGYPSNAQDMVFKVHYPDIGNYLFVYVYPTSNWDIALTVTVICGNFSASSCIAGEDENGPGLAENSYLPFLPANDYYITVSGHGTNCGPYFIAVYGEYPLPVELVSFEGTPGDREVELTWTTASETDNSHFYLIRGTDSRNLVRVSNDIPATNSTIGSSYSYMDHNLINGMTYYYKLVDVDINGLENVNGLVAEVTPLATANIAPDAYALHQNYPNPFNPTTTISYDIQEAGYVTLTVFDILGREVMTLVNQNQNAGSYSVEFNASTLSSGIYFYQLKVNDFSDLKKMVVLK